MNLGQTFPHQTKLQIHSSDQYKNQISSININQSQPNIVKQAFMNQNPQISKERYHQIQAKRQLQKRASLPMRQFEYGQSYARNVRKNKSQAKMRKSQFQQLKDFLKLEKIPIKIVKDKIKYQKAQKKYLQSLNDAQKLKLKLKDSTYQNYANFQFKDNQFEQQNILQPANYTNLSAKESYEKRKCLFKPKLSMFQRFNYQNYQNYSYKNPYQNAKHHSSKKDEIQKNRKYQFPKNHKYKPHQGSNKNLEIIFCQTKYQDFVKKANSIVENKLKQEQFNESKTQFKTSSERFQKTCQDFNSSGKLRKNISNNDLRSSHGLMNNKNITKWSYNKDSFHAFRLSKNEKLETQNSNLIKKNIFKANMLITSNINGKSTLQNHLQDFKSLQKISQYQQKQRQGLNQNKNSNLEINQDFSKTVLLDLLIHKFPFLKTLNKPFRNHFLKILFDLTHVHQKIKISIHDYLKFCRIFISRDATINELSLFIFQILFKDRKNPSLQAGKDVLQMLNTRNRKKLNQILGIICEIFEEAEQKPQKIIQKLNKNTYLLYLVIDLITKQ